MIRPFTCLTLLAAFGSGLYLYSEKHRTALLDRDISRTFQQTEAARARIGLLRAEWALLNEPGRLQDMAERYLTLKPMAPTQFTQLASLAAHLPAPVAATPGGSTDDDDTPQMASAADIAPTPQATAAGTATDEPERLPSSHPMVAAPKDASATDKLPARSDFRAHPPHHTQLADRQDPTRYVPPHGTPLPLAAPQPAMASVYSAMARPMQVSVRRQAIVSAVPSYPTAAPLAVSAPRVGSVLGGHASLPPPVPYGQ